MVDFTQLQEDLATFPNPPLDEVIERVLEAAALEFLKRFGIRHTQDEVRRRALANSWKPWAWMLTKRDRAKALFSMVRETTFTTGEEEAQ